MQDHPSATRREPSALEGWTDKVLYCDTNGSRAFLRILSAEMQGVCPCWAPFNLTGVTRFEGHTIEGHTQQTEMWTSTI